MRARWEERRGSEVGSEGEKGVKNEQGMVVNREGRRGVKDKSGKVMGRWNEEYDREGRKWGER